MFKSRSCHAVTGETMTEAEHFGVTYTVAGLHKWLHRNKFSYKKPKGLPHKADAQLQQEFIEKYNQLKQEVSGVCQERCRLNFKKIYSRLLPRCACLLSFLFVSPTHGKQTKNSSLHSTRKIELRVALLV